MFHHPISREREAGKHTDRVQADEGIQACVEGNDENDCDRGKHKDSIGVRKPVAALGQGTRQKRVLSDETCEVGKAVEAGVAAGPENQQRCKLHNIEEHGAEATRPNHISHFLRDGLETRLDTAPRARHVREPMCQRRGHRALAEESSEDRRYERKDDDELKNMHAHGSLEYSTKNRPELDINAKGDHRFGLLLCWAW